MAVRLFGKDNFKYLENKCVTNKRKVTDVLINLLGRFNTPIVFEACLYNPIKQYIENEKADLEIIPFKTIYSGFTGFILK
jgi:hypothetical protein